MTGYLGDAERNAAVMARRLLPHRRRRQPRRRRLHHLHRPHRRRVQVLRLQGVAVRAGERAHRASRRRRGRGRARSPTRSGWPCRRPTSRWPTGWAADADTARRDHAVRREHLAPYLKVRRRRVLRTAQDDFGQDPPRRTAAPRGGRTRRRAPRSTPSTATRIWSRGEPRSCPTTQDHRHADPRGDHRGQLRTDRRRPPGRRSPGRRRQRPALDVRRAQRRGRRRGTGFAGAGHREGRPGRHLGAELRRVDDRRSTRPPRSARSWSTSTRPTARTSWPMCSTSRAPRAGRGDVVQDLDYVAMVAEVRGETPDAASGLFLGHRRLGLAARSGARRSAARSWPTGWRACPTRPDQHPVHLGHNGFPEGRDAVAPQHPQQRLLHHRADQAAPPRTGCASRCPSTTASAW